MKALLLVDHEVNNLQIQEIPTPKIESDMALVAIKAAALNHRDQWCREGRYPNLIYPAVLGSDGSGVVIEVGDPDNQHWVGKEVIINPNLNWGDNPTAQSTTYKILGMPDQGTLASHIAVAVDRLKLKPDHLNFEEAAALPLAGLTAYRALFTKAMLKSGEDVLISGIGGGVAQFAFQFAMHAGANVSVTSGNQNKLNNALERGALAGFNYHDEGWVKTALKAGHQFDVVIDSAGGDQINDLLRLVKAGGIIVIYGATTGLPHQLDLRRLFWGQITLKGSTMGNDLEFIEMVDFVDKHKIKPKVDSIYAFEDAVNAFDKMKAGRQDGKIVISF